MNDLQDIVEEAPIDLESLMGEMKDTPLPFPENAVKNRAAMTSMLSDDPTKLVDTYQAILAENNVGQDITRSSIMNKRHEEEKPKDIGTIMAILGDNSIPFEQKQKAIENINSGWQKDTSVILASRTLAQASAGENIEQEDVRMSGADQFRPLFDYNQEKQSVMNKHMLTAESSTTSKVVDFLSFLQPFSANKYGVSTLKPILEELNQSISTGKAVLLPGEAMMDIKNTIANMPASEKEKVIYKLSDIIKSNSSLFLNSDNNFAELIQLQAVLDGDYSQFDRVLDNVSGILDVVGLGLVRKSKTLTSIAKRIPDIEESKILQTAITESTKPVAPINILKDTNPQKARDVYSLIIRSEGDEVAQALTGTNRESAIIDQKIPQGAKSDGTVGTKIIDPDRNARVINPDPAVLAVYNDASNMIFSGTEIARAQANIVNDLRNINGIVLHDNLVSVASDGGNKLKIQAMLGTTEGGFKKANEAFNQALFAFKEYGVGVDNLQLMKKVDGEYVPITLAETKGKFGNYMVKVDVNHQINPFDIGKMDELDVKRNWLDKIPSFISQKSGSISRHILDAASMLHPQITANAVVGVNRGTLLDKKMVELFHEFGEKHAKLLAVGTDKPSVRQAKVFDYLKEANFTKTELDDAQLIGKGFNGEEIDAIHSWRKAWDTHFWFENADAAKTLDNQDFHLFETQSEKFVAKAVGKNKNVGKVYDPASQQVVSLTELELDDLYNKGGSYAVFRRPLNLNGVDVDHMIVRNTPTEFLRRIKETDQILNYTPGYYQVHYKAPKFIVHTVRDGSGNELYTKAIGVAGDSAEAEHLKQRLATANGYDIKDVNVRADLGDMRVDTDHYWDLQNASGRTAQRSRGKRLETSTNPVTSFDTQYVVDPVESAIRASRSLSSRVAMRDFLESAKYRAIQQYEEFFPKNSVTKQPMWIEDAGSLVPKTGTLYDKKLADARTTVEYLNYLQNGYSNSLDEHIKGLFNVLATQASRIGMSTAERALIKAGDVGATNLLKSGVFTSYLALNPLRQAIIQGHQSVRLMGYNPTYMLKGKWAKDLITFSAYKGGVKNFSKEQQSVIDFIENSGMLQAVDRQNLIRGTLTDLVEAHNPVKRIIGKALAVPRKLGFDLGEQTNRVNHLLFVRDKFIQEGKDLSKKAIRDEAYAYAENLNYTMNFAGDMPYNQNSMGVFLQFMQVPHKAITSITTNRVIRTSDKLRLFLTDSLLWGVPGATVLSNLVGKDMLPDDPKARESVVFGLESTAINNALMKLVGKNPHIDFSGFSPYNTEGFAHLFQAIATGGYSEYITNSPAFSLYFKQGSKMREAFGRLMRYTGFIDTQKGLETPEALAVLNGFAEAGSSGWSNYLKAKAIYETGMIKTSKGSVLMEDATYVNAAAQLFGFKGQKEVLDYAVMGAFREGSKEHRDAVLESYNTYIKLLAKEKKLSNEDPEWAITVLGAMRNMWKKDPLAQQIIASQLERDLPDNDARMIKAALEYSKIPEATNPATINNMKILDDDKRNKALQMMEDLQRQAKEYGEQQ